MHQRLGIVLQAEPAVSMDKGLADELTPRSMNILPVVPSLLRRLGGLMNMCAPPKQVRHLTTITDQQKVC